MNVDYKILTYTGAVLDHTITDEVSDIYFKEILTSGVGHFNFSVASKMGDVNQFDDIALNDTVKIFLEYDSVGANPNFIGKVGTITSTGIGNKYVRTFSGLSQGEILLRRLKKDKFYDGVGASTMVTEWAGDLGLGTSLTVDATPVTLEVKTKSYFDLMQFVSDYWANAGTQLKKDFYVNTSSQIVYEDRPLRSGGLVETLTEGDNILSYSVDKLVENVKNDITVYGAAEKPQPDDYDGWTEGSSGDWTLDQGDSLADDAGDFQVGANSLRGYTGLAFDKIQFHRSITRLTLKTIDELTFWRKHSIQAFDAGPEIQLYAPDNANYFYYTFSTGVGDAAWRQINLKLGSTNVYDAENNDDGEWLTTGSPNWWDIQGIEIYADFADVLCYLWIDGLFFFPDRYSNNATDASTPKREMEVTDDKLHSDSDCQKRAETLLYQLQTAPTQITMLLKGNSNVLIGDRIPITLATEGISAANYDVVAVEQSYVQPNNWTTRATMVDSANTREELELSPLRKLANLAKQLKITNLSELSVR